ncbi:MAG: YicC/YloC family endoribonuclease [Gammaproteobacteria bacterium]
MTAFARATADGEWGRATWELRSVNHRYLEASMRLPEDLRVLESQARERLNQRLKRGKLDCTLKYEPPHRADRSVGINMALAERLIDVAQAVAARITAPAPIDPIDVLRWPGVLDVPPLDTEQIGASIMALFDEAVKILIDTRRREGEKLRALIDARCVQARAQVAELRTRLPGIMKEISERLTTRLAELKAELDPARLEQEMVLQASKLDVAEELDRLEAHLDEVQRVLAGGDAIGRRLDFLMQELNREANTLGSKSAHLTTTATSVELKVLIEQMREQVQNIE